jgi:hypothetical protein
MGPFPQTTTDMLLRCGDTALKRLQLNLSARYTLWIYHVSWPPLSSMQRLQIRWRLFPG